MSLEKRPAKAIDKEYRRCGGTRTTMKHGVEYLFPDGARKLVTFNITWRVAHQMIAEARRRYGGPERPALGGVRVTGRDIPDVDLTRIAVTPHAIQRRREMEAQDDLSTAEIATALTLPHRVLFFEQHGTYAFVGDRVAVVGHLREGVLTIRTFLWTTNELWERNPRPEKELMTS